MLRQGHLPVHHHWKIFGLGPRSGLERMHYWILNQPLQGKWMHAVVSRLSAVCTPFQGCARKLYNQKNFSFEFEAQLDLVRLSYGPPWSVGHSKRSKGDIPSCNEIRQELVHDNA